VGSFPCGDGHLSSNPSVLRYGWGLFCSQRTINTQKAPPRGPIRLAHGGLAVYLSDDQPERPALVRR
jgi:hypothetical protein